MIKKNNLFLNCQENQTSKFGVLRITRACLVIHMVKILPGFGRPGFDPWVGKILWRRAWQPAPVFLPGEPPWVEEPDRLRSMGS